MELLTADELSMHIQRCVMNNRESQKNIYYSFYGFAMAICNRYTKNQDDALEILNDGFLKIFKEIHRYKPAFIDETASFKAWIRKIMVYTAIDHFRRNRKHKLVAKLNNETMEIAVKKEDVLDKISHQEIIRSIQQLTPGYRTVLNLFVIEGFTHEEIAGKLQISVGASKSGLSRARKQLQKILTMKNRISYNETNQERSSENISDQLVVPTELSLA